MELKQFLFSMPVGFSTVIGRQNAGACWQWLDSVCVCLPDLIGPRGFQVSLEPRGRRPPRGSFGAELRGVDLTMSSRLEVCARPRLPIRFQHRLVVLPLQSSSFDVWDQKDIADISRYVPDFTSPCTQVG